MFTNKADWTLTYNILMDVCAHNCDTERVRELLEDMKRNGVMCTVATYNRIMMVFAKAQDPGVVDFFNTIRRDGPLPNLETYMILLHYYCDRLDDTILSVFDDLKRSGLDPDIEVYNVMLEYCGSVQDKRKSLRFFEELKVRGLAASLATYNALMAVFAESGDALIYKVFEEMNENRIKPDHTTYSVLIKHKKSLDCLRKAAEQDLLLPSLKEAATRMATINLE
jgi:pentatricopeptide repeat protein